MPTTMAKNKTQAEKKPNSKELLVDLIRQQYGLTSAVVMEDAMKNQKKQLDEAMIDKGMSMEQVAQSKGVDLGLLDGLIQSQGGQEPSKSKVLQPKSMFTKQTMTPEGNVQLGGFLDFAGMPLDKMKILQELTGQSNNIITPEKQVSTLTQTQNLLKKLGIKAKVGVTATGVPSIETQPELGLSELDPTQQLQAVALARKVAGVRGADRLIPSVVEGLKSGKTIDQVEDELRLSGQSSEFTGPLRSAAQQIMAGKPSGEKQSTFDDLDDLQGDPQQQVEYLKRMAIKNSSTDQQNRIMGKERTMELLDEVQGDLNTLEKNGFPTGFFSGNIENLMAKVGQVNNPEMRRIATKIATAVMSYRRDMTGVQFGEKESREYKILFPNIDKVGRFNTADIKGLKEVFRGDLDKFYSLSMGRDNYKKLVGGEPKQPQTQQGWTQEKETRYQELLKKRGK